MSDFNRGHKCWPEFFTEELATTDYSAGMNFWVDPILKILKEPSLVQNIISYAGTAFTLPGTEILLMRKREAPLVYYRSQLQ